MKTLLEKLAIELPIIQAPMAGISTPAMAAAVSNAGGLGSIGVGAVDAERAHEMIRAVQALTDGPININVFCHQPAIADVERESAWLAQLSPHFARFGAQPPQQLHEIYKSFVNDDEMLDLFLETRPKVVSFHFGLPSPEKIRRLKDRGIVLLATATNPSEAKLIERTGIDAVIAQGYEAGGHRGVFDLCQSDDRLGLISLTRLLVGTLGIPTIAAGGIMDGAGVAAALNLGAEAVQLGTAFIGCPESSADSYFRTALQSDAANHTVVTNAISGRPARCLKNLFTAIGSEIDPSSIPDYPIAYDAGKALNAAAKQAGEGAYGAQWAGQGAPLARTLPVKDLIAQLQSELAQTKDQERD